MLQVEQNHKSWSALMRRAIQLAALADGDTSPNPLVGAIVLNSSGNIVGEGFHARAGDSHAEVIALEQAKNKCIGGTLIVTLEPCCHTGLTPPCTDAILKSGVRKVVIGLQDPDRRVAGKGIALLREAEIEVITSVLEEEVAFQNRAFIHRITTGRPWGILKCAISLDGRTALPNGNSKWITSEKSREKVHKIRSKCDAVIVGGNTLRKDDPLLTSRRLKDPEPIRVIITSSGKLPTKAKVWNTDKARTLVAFGPKSDRQFIEKIPKNVETIGLVEDDPIELFHVLASKGCNKVLWECGPTLATNAFQKNCIQELIFFVSPKILGGTPAMTAFSDFSFSSVDQAIDLKNVDLAVTGKDFVLNMIV